MSEEDQTRRLITLWNKDIEKEDRGELEAEFRVQKWLWRVIQRAWTKLVAEDEKKKPSWIRDNKIVLCELYMTNIEALMAQIEWYIPRRIEKGISARGPERKDRDLQRRLITKDALAQMGSDQTEKSIGITFQWNKELFLHVARDRGYQTEEAVVYAVQKELGLDRKRATILINSGRFTWGQVLCTGALFEMTPREFCDIFMAGYFEEYRGEWYASHKNIDKSALLRYRVLPKGED